MARNGNEGFTIVIEQEVYVITQGTSKKSQYVMRRFRILILRHSARKPPTGDIRRRRHDTLRALYRDSAGATT